MQTHTLHLLGKSQLMGVFMWHYCLSSSILFEGRLMYVIYEALSGNTTLFSTNSAKCQKSSLLNIKRKERLTFSNSLP